MAGWITSFIRRRERGAALVEAALVLPILLLLTVGIWTTARAWNVHNTLDHAAREAARFGATEYPWSEAGSTTATCSNPGSPGSSEEAIRCIADQELAAAAIAPADVTTVCIDKANAGTDPCAVGATSTPQVAVTLEWQDYPLDFVFFTVDVDLNASAVARWEGS